MIGKDFSGAVVARGIANAPFNALFRFIKAAQGKTNVPVRESVLDRNQSAAGIVQ
jgi:hypothetical protein